MDMVPAEYFAILSKVLETVCASTINQMEKMNVTVPIQRLVEGVWLIHPELPARLPAKSKATKKESVLHKKNANAAAKASGVTPLTQSRMLDKPLKIGAKTSLAKKHSFTKRLRVSFLRLFVLTARKKHATFRKVFTSYQRKTIPDKWIVYNAVSSLYSYFGSTSFQNGQPKLLRSGTIL